MQFSNVFRCFFIAAIAVLYQDVTVVAAADGPRDVNNPQDTDVYRNLEYARVGDTPLLLDLYIPKSVKKPMPLIIWVHGGGWQQGSKRIARPVELGFLEKGYAAASIDYRLTDKAIFPAQIHDCKAAIRFLRGNAGKYGLDPNRFGIWGESAGGHLVALLGVTSVSKVLDGNEGSYLKESSAVTAVCDFFGPTDLAAFASAAENHAFAVKAEGYTSKLLGGPTLQNLDKAAKASPMTYVTKNTPPLLIVHGNKDGAVPLSESQKFYEALKKADAPVEMEIVPGAGHGGKPFRDPNLIRDVWAFFDKNLK